MSDPQSTRSIAAASAPPMRRSLQVAKMLTYFVLLVIGVTILQEMFKEIAKTNYFAELSRLSGLGAANLDTSKNIDDVVVTFFALTITFLLILPVAWVHIITKGEETDPALTQTLIALSIIVAGVMLLLEDNLARSFSLVGVVAAVRYRNTLKDPKDAVYVFLSLGIGMACGLQSYHVALFLSFFECAILLVLWVYRTGAAPLEDASLLQMLKDSEKAGKRTPAQALAWLTPEARSRLEADLEIQSRYIMMADDFAKRTGKKRPNAVIEVETAHGSAPERLNEELQDAKGNWRLLGTELRQGATVLQYLGRVQRKRSPPINLLHRLRTIHPDVRHVTFRSLRKMLDEKAVIDDLPGAAQPPSSAPSAPRPPNSNQSNAPITQGWYPPPLNSAGKGR